MDNISDAAWAVLQAVHELQAGDSRAPIDTSAARATALTILAGSAAVREFQVEGGTYAGIEAQAWELQSAGLLDVDTGGARPNASNQPAHVIDRDYRLRLTDSGREALTVRRST